MLPYCSTLLISNDKAYDAYTVLYNKVGLVRQCQQANPVYCLAVTFSNERKTSSGTARTTVFDWSLERSFRDCRVRR